MSDDELRARLRAADPAASLPRSDPDRVARLLEDTMSHPASTESRADGARHRSPLTWLVAAAAVAIIAGVAVFAVMNRADDPDQVAGPRPSATGSDVTELSAPGSGASSGRCLPPNAEALAEADVAFDGTVQEIDGALVTLSADHWYAGPGTDLVTVRGPSEEMQALLASVDFNEGGRYLVAGSNGGQVMVCGFSAPYSPRLERIYVEAFGR